VEDALVIIDGGRVAFAGPKSDTGVVFSPEPEQPDGGDLDLRGVEPDEEIAVDGFLMPGVVDRHVHIELADPAAVLAGGVTAVRDLGWPPGSVLPLAGASESPSFNGPLIRAVGPMITCTGGYPTQAGWAPAGTGLVVHGPEEAARATGEVLAASGTPLVKVALNAEAGPTLSDEELVAVCDAAHEREAIVTAHVQGRGQAERALGAGVDEFAHCPWAERLGDAAIEAMAKGMRIVSTLDIHSYGQDTPDLRTATENLNRFVLAGGRVAYGTDLGNGPIPAGIHVTEAWHLNRAGIQTEQVLKALTFRPIAPGEPADLIALASNPLESLDALSTVLLVIRAGRVVFPGTTG
jgi:imidazolonepropionase-like amidohydrolase